MFLSSYLKAYEDGTLLKVAETAFQMLESCNLCPRKCKVNRMRGEGGVCKTALQPVVYSKLAHHGEEPPVSGRHGSGTIFFSHCNMSCVYCQNYEFSQLGNGRQVEFEHLADFMLQLQSLGCHNINLVTPTHVMPQILKALCLAIPKGLKIPLVYNTSGYELPEVIKLLDGIMDIYLADMRYADAEMSKKYSGVENYPLYNRESVKEIYRQVGVAQFGRDGVIQKGLIIRHLVLPEGISGTSQIMQFIAKELSTETYVSLMSQYLPCYKALKIKELSRRISLEEYSAAEKIMYDLGLFNGWIQDSHGLEKFVGTNIKSNI